MQEHWELVFSGFDTLVLIPRVSRKAWISCRASLPAREPMKAVTDTPGRTGGTGRVVCQNGQACLGEDIQHRRHTPTGHRRGKTRSDQRFREGKNKK